MTSRDHSITTIIAPTEFPLSKAISASCKAFFMKYSSERIYHSVEREFANFKFSNFALFSESFGTTSLLTAKIQFQIVHLLYQINYLQALIPFRFAPAR
jgi:hypothetical protein